jgi:16S rRNA (cytosine967-C5)-methyltransferase
MDNIRIKCAETVQNILENKVFFAELKNQFSEKDLPFANMLILTALRHWTGLNEILRTFLKKKIPHKHRTVQYLLLLAIAELILMETAPYAVINETVKNVRAVSDKFLSGMANAVLRKITGDIDFWREKLQIINPLPASFLPILKGYDTAQIEQIAQSVFEQPRTDISVKSNSEQWAKKLNAEILPNGSLRLHDAAKISSMEGYESGDWWVQDAAAALPVLCMGDVKGKKVVDLCAAPGGKTAQLLVGGAEVIAVDISADRLEKLRQNMQRIGFEEKVQIICDDALDFLHTTEDEAFDAVLLDAPCSATGTFRRHPEVLHIKTTDDVIQQAKIQQQLLENSARIVKKGGIILYSVCSIAQAEGELQIDNFLNQHKNFKILPITDTDIKISGLIQNKGWVRTLPYHLQQDGGMDAFFICKLQRII